MEKKVTEFNGTPAQEAELRALLKEIKKMEGATMIALQRAQDIYGYLPIEVQQMIAEELDQSMEHIFGVVTFYSQFSLVPKGRTHICVCMGTACYVRGSGKVMDELSRRLGIKSGECTEDGEYELEATRCIGCCGLAPVVTVNDDVYGNLTADDVDKVLEKY